MASQQDPARVQDSPNAATACQQLAMSAADPAAQAAFTEAAQCWNELARCWRQIGAARTTAATPGNRGANPEPSKTKLSQVNDATICSGLEWFGL